LVYYGKVNNLSI